MVCIGLDTLLLTSELTEVYTSPTERWSNTSQYQFQYIFWEDLDNISVYFCDDIRYMITLMLLTQVTRKANPTILEGHAQGQAAAGTVGEVVEATTDHRWVDEGRVGAGVDLDHHEGA